MADAASTAMVAAALAVNVLGIRLKARSKKEKDHDKESAEKSAGGVAG
jgi:hypothetical protein